MSVCDSGWRSSFVGVGLSIEELSKDCVQRGALEAVVRRRPDMLVVALLGQGWLVRVDRRAAMAKADFSATDAVKEFATMS